MKKIILGAILLFSTTLFSQTIDQYGITVLSNGDAYLTQDIEISGSGNNCGLPNIQNLVIDYENLDLKGYELTLNKVNLNVVSLFDSIGGGKISLCNGTTDPNNNHNINVCIYINNGNCIHPVQFNQTLSSPTFDFARDYGYSYKAYDITGKVLSEGVTGFDTFHRLPKRQILIFKVDSFKELKIYVE